MTHKFLYIAAGVVIDTTARFYSVTLGTSFQGRRDEKFLDGYATSHGHYFAKWSTCVDEFLTRIRTSLAPIDITLLPCSGRQLVRCLKAGTSCAIPSQLLSNAHHMRVQLDLNYRISCNLAASKAKPCLARQRKKT